MPAKSSRHLASRTSHGLWVQHVAIKNDHLSIAFSEPRLGEVQVSRS